MQPQRRAEPSPSGETELSRHPRHATAADGDSDLPLPHTRDATTLLCSTAYDDNWAESELRTQKKAAPGRWKLRQRLGTATLVTSNLLILAASNVLFPRPDIVAFLARFPVTDRDEVLRELLGIELDERLRRGEVPQLEEYRSRLPDDVVTVKAAWCKAINAPNVTRFEPIDRLGVGGQGEVWRVLDPELDREVAMKVVRPGADGSAPTPATLARFRREAEINLSFVAGINFHASKRHWLFDPELFNESTDTVIASWEAVFRSEILMNANRRQPLIELHSNHFSVLLTEALWACAFGEPRTVP